MTFDNGDSWYYPNVYCTWCVLTPRCSQLRRFSLLAFVYTIRNCLFGSGFCLANGVHLWLGLERKDSTIVSIASGSVPNKCKRPFSTKQIQHATRQPFAKIQAQKPASDQTNGRTTYSCDWHRAFCADVSPERVPSQWRGGSRNRFFVRVRLGWTRTRNWGNWGDVH